MKKTTLLVLFIIGFISCGTVYQSELENVKLQFKLINYTDKGYSNAKLYIGAKDINNNFIATDSIKYPDFPSNISPNGLYSDASSFYDNSGKINGFHYYKLNAERYVIVPFGFALDGVWKPNIEEIRSVSKNLTFMLKLPNGQQGIINGYDLDLNYIEGAIAYVTIQIKDMVITGETKFNNY